MELTVGNSFIFAVLNKGIWSFKPLSVKPNKIIDVLLETFRAVKVIQETVSKKKCPGVNS